MHNLITPEEINADQANFITKVFGWMAVAFIISGYTALTIARNYSLVQLVISNIVILVIIIAAQLGFVLWLSLNIKEMLPMKVMLFFVLYAMVCGLTISMIFQFIITDSQIGIFYILAAMFGLMSALGYLTKRDLSSWGGLILMFVIGMAINLAVNRYWRNDQWQLIAAGIGVIVFVGITAYSRTQIMEMNIIGNEGSDQDRNEAIMGAFVLYLNLFFLFISIVLEANKGGKRISH